MEPGHIVAYIDRQRITCAVVLEVKNNRLRLLTDGNREVNLAASRVLHTGKNGADLSVGRDGLVDMLKARRDRRQALAETVPVRDLWEVLNSEPEWIDLATMTEFCFPGPVTDDHNAAVLQALFDNRSYFKFAQDRFFPYSEEQVERLMAQAREAARRQALIESGGDWFKRVLTLPTAELPEDKTEVVAILESLYLWGKDSPHHALGKSILARAGVEDPDAIFRGFVTLGIYDPHENVDLKRFATPTAFPEAVLGRVGTLASESRDGAGANRRDLTDLPVLTIDGQATLDFDDALSVEDVGGEYRVGIHIADVAQIVSKDDPIDGEALRRGSSIYMPDQRIPMLPEALAEGRCSLKAGRIRPALSVMARLSRNADVLDFEIFPSTIRVSSQLTYHEANLTAETNAQLQWLHDVARRFREKRLADGALLISLPEIHVWLDQDRTVRISRVNRESPGRMLVSELMILANWLMGRHLRDNGMPAVFRSQSAPRERLFRNGEGTLFQNWMQRKHLSRFVLSHAPEHHSGLGLDAYVTATSPIRKYVDLITQRQLRAIVGLEDPYSADEIDRFIQMLEQPMTQVSRLQFRRHRYWVLSYLEGRIGEAEEAIVLYKKKNSYLIMLTGYMVECDMPASGGLRLNPEDLIRVRIQRVHARKDVLAVHLG